MAWPDDADLPLEVLAAFGADPNADPSTWIWTDLSDRLLAQPITADTGRSEGARQASAGTVSVVLDNDDGALTPDHPTSAYWPNVEMNVPIWVRLGPSLLDSATVSDSFTRSVSSDWGTTTVGGLTWTRAGAGGSVLAADWGANGTAGTHRVPAANAYRRSYLAGSYTDLEVAITATWAISPTGGQVESGLMTRTWGSDTYYLFNAEIQPGNSVRAAIYRSVAGVTTTLTSTTVPGLSAPAGTALRIKASAAGTRLRMRVWRAADPEPTTWQVTTDDTAGIDLPLGGVAVHTGVATGNTNTKPLTATYDNFELRPYWDVMTGFADQWEPTFTPTAGGAFTSTVRLTASGILRRLGQGEVLLRSPLFRALIASNPTAYWPLEDAEDAQAAASAVPGVADMQPFGYSRFTVPGSGGWPVPAAGLPKFGTGDGIPGSASVIDLSLGGTLQASVPKGATAGWRIEWVMICPRDKTGARKPIQWTTDGTWDLWEFQIDSTGIFSTFGFGATLTAAGSASYSYNVFDGQPHHYRIDAIQSGSLTSAALYVDGQPVATYSAFTPPMTGSPGSIRQVVINPAEEVNGTESMPIIGHVAVWNPIGAGSGSTTAMLGYAGESATARILRLCDEERIPVSVPSPSTELMGPQGVAPLLTLLQECEQADLGLLYETRWGLGYRTRSSRYNLDPTVTVDLSAYRRSGGTDRDSILVPRFDDQQLRNEWTVSRTGGASVTVVDPVHQAAVGRYDDSIDLNVSGDAVLVNHAAWRVYLGTQGARRYPTTPLDLAANPDLIAQWLAARVGDRVARLNPPPQHPPGSIDVAMMGWSAVLSPRTWQVGITGVSYAPWVVATVDGSQRVAADGSTLAVALDEGGQTAVTDAFGRTVAAGSWGTADTGGAWTVEGTTTDYSVTGGRGRMSLGSVLVSRRAIVGSVLTDSDIVGTVYAPTATGGDIQAMQCLRWTDNNNTYLYVVELRADQTIWAAIEKRVAGTQTSLGKAPLTLTHTGTGMGVRFRARAAGSQLRLRVWQAGTTEPSTWHVTVTDTALTSGRAALRGILAAGNSNALPVLLEWDDVAVYNAARLTLASTAESGPWSTDPADFPLDMTVGGEQVTASAVAAAVTDTFTRSTSSGWGTADSGQVWTVDGTASVYSTTGSVARISTSTTGILYVAHLDTTVTDHEVRGSVTVPALPTGAAITGWVAARFVDTSNYYVAVLSIGTTGVTSVSLQKRVAGSLSTIVSNVAVGTHTAGDTWRIALSVTGSSLRAKAWKSSGAEPSTWHVASTDTSLTAGTRVGFMARRETGNTNGTLNIDWDNASVPNPQVVTLTARGGERCPQGLAGGDRRGCVGARHRRSLTYPSRCTASSTAAAPRQANAMSTRASTRTPPGPARRTRRRGRPGGVGTPGPIRKVRITRLCTLPATSGGSSDVTGVPAGREPDHRSEARRLREPDGGLAGIQPNVVVQRHRAGAEQRHPDGRVHAERQAGHGAHRAHLG